MKSRTMTHRVFLLNPKRLLIVLLASAFFLVQQKTIRQTKAAPSIPAFPGAEGFGAQSVGGRGGRVIEITNLNDSGSGSLRSCIEASGPRTCIFRTGGTIELQSGLEIINPFITIAGQTAPGGGITLKNHPSNTKATLVIKTHDVIVRYIRSRPGPSLEGTQNLDAIGIYGNAYNVILDHCSASWATDETVNTWSNPHDITIQWSIISESLDDSTHDEYAAGHSKIFLLGGDGSYNFSVHHNLIAHAGERLPTFNTSGLVDFVNNVIYNPGSNASLLKNEYGKAKLNYVRNYCKHGPDSQTTKKSLRLVNAGTNYGYEVFLQGNIGPHRPRDDMDEKLIVKLDSEIPSDSWQVSSRHPAPAITTSSAFEAYDAVLANAGCTLPMRDAVDKRIVEEVKRGEGRIIDAPSEARNYDPYNRATEILTKSDYTKYGITDPIADDGWPILAAGTAPTDTDHDGMPDEWEYLYCLNLSDPSDGPGDADGDGYTNVEEYLNGTEPSSICTRLFGSSRIRGVSH